MLNFRIPRRCISVTKQTPSLSLLHQLPPPLPLPLPLPSPSLSCYTLPLSARAHRVCADWRLQSDAIRWYARIMQGVLFPWLISIPLIYQPGALQQLVNFSSLFFVPILDLGVILTVSRAFLGVIPPCTRSVIAVVSATMFSYISHTD